MAERGNSEPIVTKFTLDASGVPKVFEDLLRRVKQLEKELTSGKVELSVSEASLNKIKSEFTALGSALKNALAGQADAVLANYERKFVNLKNQLAGLESHVPARGSGGTFATSLNQTDIDRLRRNSQNAALRAAALNYTADVFPPSAAKSATSPSTSPRPEIRKATDEEINRIKRAAAEAADKVAKEPALFDAELKLIEQKNSALTRIVKALLNIADKVEKEEKTGHTVNVTQVLPREVGPGKGKGKGKGGEGVPDFGDEGGGGAPGIISGIHKDAFVRANAAIGQLNRIQGKAGAIQALKDLREQFATNLPAAADLTSTAIKQLERDTATLTARLASAKREVVDFRAQASKLDVAKTQEDNERKRLELERIKLKDQGASKNDPGLIKLNAQINASRDASQLLGQARDTARNSASLLDSEIKKAESQVKEFNDLLKAEDTRIHGQEKGGLANAADRRFTRSENAFGASGASLDDKAVQAQNALALARQRYNDAVKNGTDKEQERALNNLTTRTNAYTNALDRLTKAKEAADRKAAQGKPEKDAAQEALNAAVKSVDPEISGAATPTKTQRKSLVKELKQDLEDTQKKSIEVFNQRRQIQPQLDAEIKRVQALKIAYDQAAEAAKRVGGPAPDKTGLSNAVENLKNLTKQSDDLGKAQSKLSTHTNDVKKQLNNLGVSAGGAGDNVLKAHDKLLLMLGISRLLPGTIGQVGSGLALISEGASSAAGKWAALAGIGVTLIAQAARMGAEFLDLTNKQRAQAEGLGIVSTSAATAVQQVKAIDLVLQQTGGSIENFAVGFKKVNEAITGIGPEAKQTQTLLDIAFAGTGFNFRGSNPTEIILKLAQNIKQLETAGLGSALAAQIFGRSWDEVKGRLQDLADQYPAAEKAVHDSFTKEDEQRARTYAKAIADLDVAWQRIASNFAVPVTGLINLIVKITPFAGGLHTGENIGEAYSSDRLKAFGKVTGQSLIEGLNPALGLARLAQETLFEEKATAQTKKSVEQVKSSNEASKEFTRTLEEGADAQQKNLEKLGVYVTKKAKDAAAIEEAAKREKIEHDHVNEILKNATPSEKEAQQKEIEKGRVEAEIASLTQDISETGKSVTALKLAIEQHKKKGDNQAALADLQVKLADKEAEELANRIRRDRLQAELKKFRTKQDHEERQLFDQQLEDAREHRRGLIPGTQPERTAEGAIESLLSNRISALRARYQAGDKESLAELNERIKQLNQERRKANEEVTRQILSEQERLLADFREQTEETVRQLEGQKAEVLRQLQQLGERGALPFAEVITSQVQTIERSFAQYKALREVIINNLNTERALVTKLLGEGKITPVEAESKLRQIQKSTDQQRLDVAKQQVASEHEISTELINARQEYIGRRQFLLELDLDLQRRYQQRRLILLQAGARDSLVTERAQFEAETALEQRTARDKLAVLQNRYRDLRNLFVERQGRAGQTTGVGLSLPDVIKSTNLDQVRQTLENLTEAPTEQTQQLLDVLKEIASELNEELDGAAKRLVRSLELQLRAEQQVLDVKRQQLDVAQNLLNEEGKRTSFLEQNNLLTDRERQGRLIAQEQARLQLLQQQLTVLQQQGETAVAKLARQAALSGVPFDTAILKEIKAAPELANLNKEYVQLVEQQREATIGLDLMTSRLGQFRTGISEIAKEIGSLPEPFNKLLPVFEGLQKIADVLLNNRTRNQTPAQELERASDAFSQNVTKSAKTFYDQTVQAVKQRDDQTAVTLRLLNETVRRLDDTIKGGTAKYVPEVSDPIKKSVLDFVNSIADGSKAARTSLEQAGIVVGTSLISELSSLGKKVEAGVADGIISPIDKLTNNGAFQRLSDALDKLSQRLNTAATPPVYGPPEIDARTGYNKEAADHLRQLEESFASTKRKTSRNVAFEPASGAGLSDILKVQGGFARTESAAAPATVYPTLPQAELQGVEQAVNDLIKKRLEEAQKTLGAIADHPLNAQPITSGVQKFIVSAGKFIGAISQFAGNLFAGFSSGSVGGKISGIGGAIGSLGSLFKVGSTFAKALPIVGAIAQIAGGVFDFIGSIYKAKAEKIANKFQDNFDSINQKLRDGSITLGEAVSQLQSGLQQARAQLTTGKVGKKGGSATYAQLEKQVGQQIADLRRQQKQIQDEFAKDLESLRLPSEQRGAFKDLSDVVQKIKTFLNSFDSAADAAAHLADAHEYLLLTEQDLAKSTRESLTEIRKREADAIGEFLRAHDQIINEGRVQTPVQQAQDRLERLFDLEKKRAEDRAKNLQDITKQQSLLDFIQKIFDKFDKSVDRLADRVSAVTGVGGGGGLGDLNAGLRNAEDGLVLFNQALRAPLIGGNLVPAQQLNLTLSGNFDVRVSAADTSDVARQVAAELSSQLRGVNPLGGLLSRGRPIY